jgi:hypothetical protein
MHFSNLLRVPHAQPISSSLIWSLYQYLPKGTNFEVPHYTIFSSSPCVQTGSGAHQASYAMGTGGTFPGGKARPGRDPDHSPPSSAEVKYEQELYLLSPHVPPWRAAGQLYLFYVLTHCTVSSPVLFSSVFNTNVYLSNFFSNILNQYEDGCCLGCSVV